MEEFNIKDLCSPLTLLIGYRGSIAHGLYVPPTDPDSIDDQDYLSVVVPGPQFYLGLSEWHSSGTREHFADTIDLLEYELRKFLRLLLKGNPNVISLLYLKPAHYLYISPLGQRLIDNREIFHSQEMIRSFCGYANAQLSKMGKFNARGFRGEKRAELIERHGYDTKNASHCLRLLRMCIEFLETGAMNVDRTGIDAEELLEVKRGRWSQDRVIAESTRLFSKLKDIRSPLPRYPNYFRAGELCIEIVREALKAWGMKLMTEQMEAAA